MRAYIFGAKNKTEIIDLEKTAKALEDAKAFVSELSVTGKKILFVGTKPEAREAVAAAAEKAGQPYMTERWIGGTLTNFPQIRKRVERLGELLEKKEKGELDVYTKKERLLFDRELEKLLRDFGGITSLSSLPDALFVVDPRKEAIAVKEASREGIPVIALASSDCDISAVSFPIPGNDAVRKSITLIADAIADAYVGAGERKEGKEAAPAEEKKK